MPTIAASSSASPASARHLLRRWRPRLSAARSATPASTGFFDGTSMTSGYCVYANDVYWFWERNLYFSGCPGNSQILGFNNAQLEVF